MTSFICNLALVIGINQYQKGIASLNTAKPDAGDRTLGYWNFRRLSDRPQ